MMKILIFIIALQLTCGDTERKKPLEGHHLRVLPLHVPPSIYLRRNASGSIVAMDGFCAEVLYWLSRNLGFTYSIVETAPGIIYDDSSSGRGWKSFILNGETDFVIGPIASMATRLPVLDYSYPTYMSFYQLLIPSPEQSANFGAPWEPFSLEVWITLFISVPVLIIIMSFTSRCVLSDDVPEDADEHHFDNTVRSTDYVVQVLLAQGNYCPTKRLAIRLLAGVWCLASFFLVNFYYSTFISYASASNPQPIIDKLSDIPAKHNVRVAVNYGWAIDLILSSSDSGTLKYLRDLLNRDASFRCKSTDKCIDKVKMGPTAYINTIEFFASLIEEDVRKTGQCHFTVAKDKFLPQLLAFVYPKNSKYRRHIDTQFWETGLSSVWNVKYSRNITKCLKPAQQTEGTNLGLKHLSSVFIILLFGSCVALMIYFAELIVNFLIMRKERVTFVEPIMH